MGFLFTFLFTVNQYVTSEVTRLGEKFSTLLTFMRLHSTMNDHVNLYYTKHSKLFGTLFHLWGFTPLWINMRVLRLLDRVKDLIHSLHLWDFSPLWFSMCFLRSANTRFSTLFTFLRFSPLWIRICLLRSPGLVNDLVHYWTISYTVDIYEVCLHCEVWVCDYWSDQT